ncbi:MAG: molybdenum cofactor biosysynthesis protein [Verrucomicrobiales bacterium]
MRVLRIFISPEHNYFGHYGKPPGDAPMVELAEAELVAGQGIAGDRFFGFKDDYKGQVTFFSAEVFDDLCARFGVADRDADAFRRNLLVSGVDLNSLIGEEFEIQGIRFRGDSECSPCYWMEQAFCEGAEAALKGRGGLRAKILTSGTLRAEAPHLSPAHA